MQNIETLMNGICKNNKKIFAIHGGGNIGLGCMADIISRSPHAYHIIATSSDKFMNNLINSNNQLWLKHSTTMETRINNISMLYSRNPANIVWLYTHANLLALCVTENALSNIISNIATGLIKRYLSHGRPLKILVLMNKPNADEFVKQKITTAIHQKINDANYAASVLSIVKIVPTVVDRVVNKIEKKYVCAQLKKQLLSVAGNEQARELLYNESIDTILCDEKKLITVMQKFKLKFYLFNAEYQFLFYLPDYFQEFKHLPNVKTVSNLNQFAEIKNKFINGPHAILAWMGGFLGCKTIAETIKNPSMFCYINKLMNCEIGPILKAAYPTISVKELETLKNLFIQRCQNSHEDPIVRVGRDPLRKMSKGERIRGIIELRQKHHLNIPTPELEKGMAVGILYAINNIDPTNAECRKIAEIFRRNYSYKAVLCYKGSCGNTTFAGLDAAKDGLLIKNILERIAIFQKIAKLKRLRMKKGI